MNLQAILKVAFRALVRNKVRSLLTTLGIIVGIAAVIAMVAVGRGATVMIQDQVKSMGNNMVIVFPGSSHTGGFRGGTGSIHTLTNEDGEEIIKESLYVHDFTPTVRSGGQATYQENNWGTSVQGVNSHFQEVRNWPLAEGDFFTDSDVRIASRVCVLGKTVVDNLFQGEDPVGKTLRIKNMPFHILGVLAPKGSTAWGQDQDDTIVAPWTTVQRVLQNTPFHDVGALMLELNSMDNLDIAKDQISSILRERHHLARGADDDFSIMDMTEVTDTISKVSVVMTALLTAIASISLLVGGIGIMNIMLVSVTERTREIGLRMAVGAKRWDILMQFLVEAMVLSGIGGLLGVGLGAGAALILSYTAKWPVLISFPYMIVALAFSAAVGIFFGFYPAWRASKLDPIEALRYE